MAKAPNVAPTSPEQSPANSEHFSGNVTNVTEGDRSCLTKRPKLSMIPTELIDPSPLNPRRHFDEESLKELVESIRAHGIQQPLVVRQMVRDVPAPRLYAHGNPPGGHVSYLIVMGERRWRAAKLAGLATIPCLVRTALDDKAHAQLALEENVRRRDLTPIEEARGYKQCMTLGTTQRELGDKAGVGQSRISNLIRLLELPEDVQELIDAGKLTPAHGLALLSRKYLGHAALIFAAAQDAYESGRAVKDLEAGPNHNILSSLPQDIHRDLSYAARFDKSVCKQCPFNAYVKDNWGNEHCLNPAHYDELTAEADVVRREQQQAIALEQALRFQKQAAKAGETPTEGASTPHEGASTPTDAVPTLPTLPALADIGPGNYCTLGGISSPCCDTTCPCRTAATDHRGDVQYVCTDPPRFKALYEAEEARRVAARLAPVQPLADEAIAQLAGPLDDAPGSAWARALAKMAALRCNSMDNSAVSEARALLHLPVDDKVLTVYHYGGLDMAKLDALATLSPTDLIRFLLALDVISDLRTAARGGEPTFLPWLLGRTISVPEEEDQDTEKAGSGVWMGDDALLCARCGDVLPPDAFGDVDPVDGNVTTPLRMSSGDLLTPLGAAYCGSCGPSVQICRVCGCTEEMACEDGCSWAIEDEANPANCLCSACVDKPGGCKTGEEIQCQRCGEKGHWATRITGAGEYVPSALCTDCMEAMVGFVRLCKKCGFARVDFLPGSAICEECDEYSDAAVFSIEAGTAECPDCRGKGRRRYGGGGVADPLYRGECYRCGGTGRVIDHVDALTFGEGDRVEVVVNDASAGTGTIEAINLTFWHGKPAIRVKLDTGADGLFRPDQLRPAALSDSERAGLVEAAATAQEMFDPDELERGAMPLCASCGVLAAFGASEYCRDCDPAQKGLVEEKGDGWGADYDAQFQNASERLAKEVLA